MTDIFFDLGAEITDLDIKNLRKKLKTLGSQDEIIISMEAADTHQADEIIEELQQQGFDYQSHGGHGKGFYLIARKKL